MKPTYFKEKNVVFGDGQPEYMPLPAFYAEDEAGTTVHCWKCTIRERLRILIFGRVYVSQLTFRKPLQPLALSPYKSDLLNVKEVRVFRILRDILAIAVAIAAVVLLLSCSGDGSRAGYVVDREYTPARSKSYYDPSIHRTRVQAIPEKWTIWIGNRGGSFPVNVSEEDFERAELGKYVEF